MALTLTLAQMVYMLNMITISLSTPEYCQEKVDMLCNPQKSNNKSIESSRRSRQHRQYLLQQLGREFRKTSRFSLQAQ